MKLVYGIFPNLQPAEDARTVLHRSADQVGHPEDASTVAIHRYDIRPSDLPLSGNFAMRSAIVGGLSVATIVGLFLGLLMAGVFAGIGGPPTITGSDPIDVVFLTLAVGLFGGIAAGIAGSSGNRARIRALESEVARGNVLLTLEAPNARITAIQRMMSRCGAMATGSI